MKKLILMQVLCLSLLPACRRTLIPLSDSVFPNEVGDQWTYKYSPTGRPVDDTGFVQVNIVGQLKLPDGELAKIWQTTYSDDPGFSDSTLVVDSASTVKIYFNNICPSCTEKMPMERRRYQFPLRVGDQQTDGFNSNDTVKVLAQLPLQVPAGNFPATYQLAKTVGYSFNSFTKDTIFITPAVGVTKYFQDEFSLGPFLGNGLWELSSYQLK